MATTSSQLEIKKKKGKKPFFGVQRRRSVTELLREALGRLLKMMVGSLRTAATLGGLRYPPAQEQRRKRNRDPFPESSGCGRRLGCSGRVAEEREEAVEAVGELGPVRLGFPKKKP